MITTKLFKCNKSRGCTLSLLILRRFEVAHNPPRLRIIVRSTTPDNEKKSYFIFIVARQMNQLEMLP